MNEELDLNVILEAVSSQRNSFANEVAVLKGRLAAATAKIADLENQLKTKTGEEPKGEGPPTS